VSKGCECIQQEVRRAWKTPPHGRSVAHHLRRHVPRPLQTRGISHSNTSSPHLTPCQIGTLPLGPFGCTLPLRSSTPRLCPEPALLGRRIRSAPAGRHPGVRMKARRPVRGWINGSGTTLGTKSMSCPITSMSNWATRHPEMREACGASRDTHGRAAVIEVPSGRTRMLAHSQGMPNAPDIRKPTSVDDSMRQSFPYHGYIVGTPKHTRIIAKYVHLRSSPRFLLLIYVSEHRMCALRKTTYLPVYALRDVRPNSGYVCPVFAVYGDGVDMRGSHLPVSVTQTAG
jgi:hypothetical protein